MESARWFHSRYTGAVPAGHAPVFALRDLTHVQALLGDLPGTVLQAPQGCDFDFLETDFGAPVDEPSIF